MIHPGKVAIIDKQPLFVAALTAAMKAAWPDVEVSAQDNFVAGLRGVTADAFDVVLVDMATLEGGGAAALERLVSAARATPVLAVSQDDAAPVIVGAVAAGVRGFLPRTMTGEAMCSAVALAFAGASCIPAHALVGAVRDGRSHPHSERELAILRHLDRGSPNKVIARELGLSVATIKVHIQAILRATGAKNRTEAIAIARRIGVLSMSA